MAFSEAGAGTESTRSKGAHGLPMAWGNLDGDRCPRCGGDLVYFENVDLWKCPSYLNGSEECGFKIGSARANEIVQSIRDGGETVRGYSDGYALGDYQQEPPF